MRKTYGRSSGAPAQRWFERGGESLTGASPRVIGPTSELPAVSSIASSPPVTVTWRWSVPSMRRGCHRSLSLAVTDSLPDGAAHIITNPRSYLR